MTMLYLFARLLLLSFLIAWFSYHPVFYRSILLYDEGCAPGK